MTLRLFVADDSVTIQRIVKLALSDEDVIIESVASGDSALESARAFRPDLVLADVCMPGCSGYEVCARIKEDPDLTDTPVILLVGTFEPFDEAEASRVRCNGHLTKPFDTEELIQTVRSFAGDKMIQPRSEDSAEPSTGTERASDTVVPKVSLAGVKGFVSASVMESFLGSNRILDFFDPETFASFGTTSVPKQPGAAKSISQADQLPEDFINLLVDRVVRRMSADVIREVAWEVVPELSEALIRQTITEQSKS